jgi:eukaryotic-like serine/threonine-protein kinase
VQGVHRDVKIDNILVRPEDSWPTLLDFGAGDFLGAPTLTRELLPPGTPYHRSPEALRFHWLNRQVPGAHYKPGAADDIYALGVTAYCLVTGTYPPPVLPPELLASDPSFQPPVWEPPEHLVTVCPELAALIRQMLSLDPSARGSAVELSQAFGEAARSAGPEADQLMVPRALARGGVASRAEAPASAVPGAGLPVNQPRVQSSGEGATARKSPMVSPRMTRVLWPWVALTAGLVALVILQAGGARHHPEGSVAHDLAGHAQEHRGEDASSSGLGEVAFNACGGREEPAPSRKEIGVEIPKTPLPGQVRPPCKRREVEINGGCWKLLAGSAPPCTEREYEWRGLCYFPVIVPSPPATSEQR